MEFHTVKNVDGRLVFDSFDKKGKDGLLAPTNAKLVSTVIPNYLCPSAGEPKYNKYEAPLSAFAGTPEFEFTNKKVSFTTAPYILEGVLIMLLFMVLLQIRQNATHIRHIVPFPVSLLPLIIGWRSRDFLLQYLDIPHTVRVVQNPARQTGVCQQYNISLHFLITLI